MNNRRNFLKALGFGSASLLTGCRFLPKPERTDFIEIPDLGCKQGGYNCEVAENEVTIVPELAVENTYGQNFRRTGYRFTSTTPNDDRVVAAIKDCMKRLDEADVPLTGRKLETSGLGNEYILMYAMGLPPFPAGSFVDMHQSSAVKKYKVLGYHQSVGIFKVIKETRL